MERIAQNITLLQFHVLLSDILLLLDRLQCLLIFLSLVVGTDVRKDIHPTGNIGPFSHALKVDQPYNAKIFAATMIPGTVIVPSTSNTTPRTGCSKSLIREEARAVIFGNMFSSIRQVICVSNKQTITQNYKNRS